MRNLIRNGLRSLVVYLLLIAILAVLSPVAVTPAFSEPGDVLRNVLVPVPAEIGIGLALNCDHQGVTLFYTNTNDCTLYKMDTEGNLIEALPFIDANNGQPLSRACPAALQWDETRQMLWGGGESRISGTFFEPDVPIYLIDPDTGVTTLAFIITFDTGLTFPSFTDGITYDAATDRVYFSDDLNRSIGEFDANPPHNLLRIITPEYPDGTPVADDNPAGVGFSGILVTNNNIMFGARDGLNKVNRIRMSDWISISDFPSPNERDEDMECDALTFAPLEAIWIKGARTNDVTAFEVELGTCLCGGVEPPPPTPTPEPVPPRMVPTMSEWGHLAVVTILLGTGILFLRRRRGAV